MFVCALVHLNVHVCVQELTEVWRSPFNLELQAIVSPRMSAGNQTQVFPKSSKRSDLLSELSLQLSLLFPEEIVWMLYLGPRLWRKLFSSNEHTALGRTHTQLACCGGPSVYVMVLLVNV